MEIKRVGLRSLRARPRRLVHRQPFASIRSFRRPTPRASPEPA
jgi:hypothetical protein